MPTFIPSGHSQNYGFDLPDPFGLRDAAAGWITGDDGETASAHYVQVSDSMATCSVRSNGIIEVLSNEYGNEGDIYKPGNATYDQVMKNLMKVAGNQAKIEAIIGKAAVDKSLLAPPVKTPSGVPATMDDVVEGDIVIPFHKQPWFMPAVAGLGAAAVIGAILFWPKK